MKVLVASTIVPGVRGGASIIVDSLERALVNRGHEVDVLRLPFHSDPGKMLPQMLAMRLHHVSDFADRLVCIRTPSYLLQHPTKVLWFIHHHRGAYDLWGTPYGDIQDSTAGRSLRDAIRAADEVAFAESRWIFANSGVMRDRLRRYNQRSAEVLYPPLDHPESFRCDSYGDSIVYVSRLAIHKRQSLAIEAMMHTTTPVRLIVAGPPDRPEDGPRLGDLIRARGLEHKVELIPRWITEDEKVRLYAECLAAVYCPFDEDSYGYPTLEASQSRKPVVSTTDAGGVAELVADGVNGFLVEPNPLAMARRFDELYEDPAAAQRMGEAGFRRIEQLGISWDNVVSRLLS
jgi:glycosyltransferase involved in cell wall biosynthesis